MFRFLQQTTYCTSGNSLSDQLTSGGIFQLQRVQSVDVDLVYPRTEEIYVTEQHDHTLVQRPHTNLSFEWIETAGPNERAIGFVTDGYHSAFWMLNQEKNYYVQMEDEVVDANFPNSSTKKVLGISQVLINGYNIAGSVGEFIRATCTAQGLNSILYSGNTNELIPTVDPEFGDLTTGLFALPPANSQVSDDNENPANNVKALGAKDLLMEFPTGSVFATAISGDGCLLQNFNLAFSFDRSESRKLGSAYPYERRLALPIHVTLSVEAVMNQYHVDRLNELNCGDSGHDINILIKQPCSDLLALEFYLRGLKLESQKINSKVGELQTVNFEWNGVITNLNDSGNNVFMKAHHGTQYYMITSMSYVTGDSVLGDPSIIEQIKFERLIEEQQFFSGQIP